MKRMLERPDSAFVISEILPLGSIGLWHAQPRAMKSLASLEAALAMTTGTPAFGSSRFSVPRVFRVAYFTEEDTDGLVYERLGWFLKGRGLTEAPEPLFLSVRQGADFDSQASQDQIIGTIREQGAEVAIFDPLRGFTALSDKGPADLRPVVKFFRRIQRETACKTLILPHHDTKEQLGKEQDTRTLAQRASGGGIFSMAEAPIHFEKVAETETACVPSGFKASNDPKPFRLHFESAAIPFRDYVRAVAETVSENDVAHQKIEKKLLRAFGAHAGKLNASAVKDTVGGRDYNLAMTVLEDWKAQGKVTEGTGNHGARLFTLAVKEAA
jgi:RecA-family ATPase